MGFSFFSSVESCALSLLLMNIFYLTAYVVCAHMPLDCWTWCVTVTFASQLGGRSRFHWMTPHAPELLLLLNYLCEFGLWFVLVSPPCILFKQRTLTNLSQIYVLNKCMVFWNIFYNYFCISSPLNLCLLDTSLHFARIIFLRKFINRNSQVIYWLFFKCAW